MSVSRKSVILDTNLLVLLVVGTVDEGLIAKCKRTQSFDVDAFVLLIAELMRHEKHQACAAVLAETCNLLESENAKRDHRLFDCLRTMVSGWESYSVEPTQVMAARPYLQFGFTDATLAELLQEQGNLVLTIDAPMYAYVSRMKRKGEIVNFNHLRFERTEKDQKQLIPHSIIQLWRQKVGWLPS